MTDIQRKFDEIHQLGEDGRAAAIAELRGADAEAAAMVASLIQAAETPDPEPLVRFEDFAAWAKQNASLEIGSAVRVPGGPADVLELLSDPQRIGETEVYRVRYRASGEHAALKVLAWCAPGQDRQRRFRLEGELLRGLDHPGVARLLSAGTCTTAAGATLPAIVIEFIEGETFERRLAAAPPRELARQIAEAARAVHHINLRGIVHRDLKPRNIMVTPDGGVKVLDFGVAKLLDAAEVDASRSLATEGLTIVGTPMYMAPEQLAPLAAEVDLRADVYALGAMLHEAITGDPPVRTDGRTRREIWSAKSEFTLRSPLKEGLPADLGVVAATACAAEPSERHESCAELAEEIERALNYRPLKRRPPGPLRRSALFARRRPVASVALLVTLCAMIGAAGVYESQQRRVAAERDRALARFNAASDFARWVIFELERELLMLPGTRAARLRLINEAQKTLDSLLVDPTADDALRLAIAEAHVRLEEIVWYERGDFEAGLENRRSVQRLIEGIEGPEADMLRAWTRFRSGLERTRSTRDPLAPVEPTLEALDQLLSLEGKLDDDPRYWRWRARIGYHASRRLVDTDAPPERIRAVLARAVADGKRAIELDPSDPLALREYAEAHVYRALGERNVGGPGASAFSLAAIEAAREVERRGHPDGQALIAKAEMQRGRYFEELGAPDEALAIYTQAIERLEPVVARDPDRKRTTRLLEVAHGWRATLCLEELRKGRDDLFDIGYESAKRGLALHKLRIERNWVNAVVEDDYLRNALDGVEAYEVIKARRRTGE